MIYYSVMVEDLQLARRIRRKLAEDPGLEEMDTECVFTNNRAPVYHFVDPKNVDVIHVNPGDVIIYVTSLLEAEPGTGTLLEAQKMAGKLVMEKGATSLTATSLQTLHRAIQLAKAIKKSLSPHSSENKEGK